MATSEEKKDTPDRIPVFKSTGSIMNDLKAIKVAEMIAFGCWRGKLRKLLEENGQGTILADGSKGYWLDNDFGSGHIDTDRNFANNSFEQSMLELAGMDREALDNFKSDLGDAKMIMDWGGGFEPELDAVTLYMEDAFAYHGIAKFHIDYSIQRFKLSNYPTREDRVDMLYTEFEERQGLYTNIFDEIVMYANSDAWAQFETISYAATNKNILISTTGITFYDSGGTVIEDVDPEVDNTLTVFGEAVKMLCLMSQSAAFTGRQVISYEEELIQYLDDDFMLHNVVEKYDASIVTGFSVDNEIPYTNATNDYEYDEVTSTFIPSDVFQQPTVTRTIKDSYKDLFWGWANKNVPKIVKEGDLQIFKAEGGKLYITEWGLKSSPPDELALSFSNNFNVYQDTSGNFLKMVIIFIILVIIVIYTWGTASSAVGAASQMAMTVMVMVETVLAIVSFLRALASLLSFIKMMDADAEEGSESIEEDESVYEGELVQESGDEYDTFLQYNKFRPYDNNGEFPLSVSFEKLYIKEIQFETDNTLQELLQTIDKGYKR